MEMTTSPYHSQKHTACEHNWGTIKMLLTCKILTYNIRFLTRASADTRKPHDTQWLFDCWLNSMSKSRCECETVSNITADVMECKPHIIHCKPYFSQNFNVPCGVDPWCWGLHTVNSG